MSDENPLSSKVGLDTTDFKTGVAALNREIRVIESGFRASAAALGDWSKDATGLEQRIGSLTQTIDLQRQKVEATRREYERIKAEKGENSRAAQDLEIKLNRETESLNKMTVELSETEQNLADLQDTSDETADAVEELGESSDQAGSGMETMRSVAGGLWSALQVGLGVVLGLAGAVAGLTATIGGLVFSTASSSAELVDLSARTGITTTRLQELSYAGDQVGTSSETMVSSLARLTRSMGTAQEQAADYAREQAEARAEGEEFDGQLGDMAAAFERLNVSTTDSSGNLRDNEAVFADVIDALGGIGNETERDALAMSIFGKSAQELNPLIKAGSEELARLSEQAHEVGAVMAEEDVAAFEAFDDTLASLQAGLKGTLGTLGAAFLPGFQQVFDQAGGYLKEFAGIVKGSDGDLSQMATGVSGLLQKIITDLAAQGPQYLQGGLTILQGIIDAILQSLPGMLPVALQLIQTLLTFLTTSLPQLMTAGVQILLMLITGIVTGLPALVETALQMIITLVQGLAQAMPTLIPMIATIIPVIIQTILANLPLLIEAALQLILALAQGLIAALPILIPAIPVIIQTIFDVLIQSLPMILTAAGELIAVLVMGIIAALPGVLDAALQIIQTLYNALNPIAMLTMLLEIGKGIVDGIWRGIQGQKDVFLSQIKGFFAGLVSTVKNALGISSPSKLFADQVGKQIPAGIGQGFEQAMPGLERDLGAAMGNLTRNYEINASASQRPATGSAAGGNETISIGDIIVNLAQGVTEPLPVAQAVKNGVLEALRARGGA